MAEVASEVAIRALGRRGDGEFDGPDGPLHVAGALPGERVRVAVDGDSARLLDVLAPSPARAAPSCRHFGTCGGCMAQHMTPAFYREWKRGQLTTALARQGIAADVPPLVDATAGGRRRATFHAHARAAGAEVGYMRARSHEIVAIDACPILSAGLAGALPAARAVADALRRLGKPLDLLATAADTGLDLDLRGAGGLDPRAEAALSAIAEAHDLARLSNHGKRLVERRAPTLRMGSATVALPPGGFLQATAAAEDEIAARAIAHFGAAERLADLFCGIGAFALRLAERASVMARDSDAAAIAALARAARATPGLRPVDAGARDLFRRPMAGAELDGLDGALFDPPRAGAEAQARALAVAGPPKVFAVACDAGTFARDARILLDGGYRMVSVAGLDQFAFSAHIEIVAAFERPRAPRARRRLLG